MVTTPTTEETVEVSTEPGIQASSEELAAKIRMDYTTCPFTFENKLNPTYKHPWPLPNCLPLVNENLEEIKKEISNVHRISTLFLQTLFGETNETVN